MTDEAKLAHLNKLCSTDEWRVTLSSPFLVTIDGEQWSMASDGKMLFAWRGKVEGVEPRKDAPRVPQEWVTKSLSASKLIAIDALRSWAGDPVYPSMKDCPTCKGTGGTKHDCDCDYCERGDDECFDCDGEAKVLTEDMRHGVIGGFGFNRNYIAMLLDGVEGSMCIDPSVDKYDHVRMRGDDWIAIVMPMNLDPEEIGKAPALMVCE